MSSFWPTFIIVFLSDGVVFSGRDAKVDSLSEGKIPLRMSKSSKEHASIISSFDVCF